MVGVKRVVGATPSHASTPANVITSRWSAVALLWWSSTPRQKILRAALSRSMTPTAIMTFSASYTRRRTLRSSNCMGFSSDSGATTRPSRCITRACSRASASASVLMSPSMSSATSW